MFSGPFPFSEHINELRERLKIVAYTFIVIFVVLIIFPVNPMSSIHNPGQYLSLAFLQNTLVAAFLHRVVAYILPNPCPVGGLPTPGCWSLIAAAGLGEGMEVYFIAALILTITIDLPVIAYETYRFIGPALTEREKKLVYPFVLSSSALFVAGLLFGYFVIARLLIIAQGPFLVAGQISFQIDAYSFYAVVFLIIGATGVSFTSPVFVYTLIRLQILNADLFSRNRVIIWFIIWVITGLFLTPDGGPLLDVVIFIPIVAMVEIAVALGRRSVRGQPPKAKKGGVVCPSCGKPLPRPMLFCEHCGKSVA